MTFPAALPTELTELVLDNLREVPDFPEPGVLFRDITPLLANGKAFAEFISSTALSLPTPAQWASSARSA